MDTPYNRGFCDPEDLRAFLLGRLREADASPIEERLIGDEAFFLEVQDAEDELIDDYAMGVLPQTDAGPLVQRSERQPEFAQRLAIRKAFFAALNSGSQQPAKTSFDPLSGTASSRLVRSRRYSMPGLIPGLAIAASLLLVACTLLLHKKHEAETRLPQLEQQTQTTPPLHAMQRPSAVSAATPIVSEMFFPLHASRGIGEQPPLQISAAPSRLVEFQLETPVNMSNMQRWTISITQKHDTLFLQRGLHMQQVGGVSFVRVYVDSSTLGPGSYSVLLSSDAGSQSSYSIRWTLVATK